MTTTPSATKPAWLAFLEGHYPGDDGDSYPAWGLELLDIARGVMESAGDGSQAVDDAIQTIVQSYRTSWPE